MLYRSLRLCDLAGLRCRAGFVHLPHMTEQPGHGDEPHLPEAVLLAGVRAALQCLAELPPQDEIEPFDDE